MDSRIITLTPAAHKHGNLNIRVCGKSFFPQDAFGGSSRQAGLGVPITLNAIGLQEPIKTDIPKDSKKDRPKWIFRRRAWVKKFVRLHNLKTGDNVVINRIAPRKYSIVPKKTKCYLVKLDKELESHFSGILKVDTTLTRKVVSYQGNKTHPFYRWYKYKEAFSVSLVEYLLEKYDIPKGIIFDPFAGMGTTLFASAFMGYNSEGIELLPIGQQIILNRIFAQFKIKKSDIDIMEFWIKNLPWKSNQNLKPLNYLRITQGAYPSETEVGIRQYLSELARLNNKSLTRFLRFALLCILESVSFTRKDGQYLRWDHRSGRGNGKNTFDKGKISHFDEAITGKLKQILSDIKNPSQELFADVSHKKIGTIKLHRGSCLDMLPKIRTGKFKAIITSPPYCNRYDYTRTYALEHALLGVDEQELTKLRQTMLSCTVENKSKEILNISDNYSGIVDVFESQKLINVIVDYLNEQKKNKTLNNNGIPRMVRGYFYEMTAVISECFRVLDKNTYMFMVNDNVRYAGVCIPVDLILSKIAEDIGFDICNILVLPQKKGNSSQQMGGFGKKSLRKCVYVWRKP